MKGLVRRRQVLEIGGAGVAGADEREDSGAGGGGGLDQGLQGVGPEQRVGGERVDAEAGNGPPGRRGLADQGLPVGSGGDRHVAPLGIGDDKQAGLGGDRPDLGKSRPAGRAEPLEAGELRLDGDAGRAGALDQRAAVGDEGAAATSAGVPSTVGPRSSPVSCAGSGSRPRQT